MTANAVPAPAETELAGIAVREDPGPGWHEAESVLRHRGARRGVVCGDRPGNGQGRLRSLIMAGNGLSPAAGARPSAAGPSAALTAARACRTPQPRLTAVGLAALIASAAASTSSPRAAASATPKAPATPSRGAPRTTRRPMASTSWLTSVHLRNASTAGSLVWSSSSMAGPPGSSSHRSATMSGAACGPGPFLIAIS